MLHGRRLKAIPGETVVGCVGAVVLVSVIALPKSKVDGNCSSHLRVSLRPFRPFARALVSDGCSSELA